jgi:hypothetical protein
MKSTRILKLYSLTLIKVCNSIVIKLLK